MGAVKKLSVALTQELGREIEAAVASGDYSTASEVVRDALRTWRRERADRMATALLDAADGKRWKRPQTSPDGDLLVRALEPIEGNFDAEEIGRRGRARLAARRRPAG